MRDRIVIATKCGIREKGDPDKDATHRYDLSKGTHHPLCDASLKRMGLDYITSTSCTWPDYLMEQDEIALAFESLTQAGKVRVWVSNFSGSFRLPPGGLPDEAALQPGRNQPDSLRRTRGRLARLVSTAKDHTAGVEPARAGQARQRVPAIPPQPEPYAGAYDPRRTAPRGQGGGMQPDCCGAGVAVTSPGRHCANHRQHQPGAHPRCRQSGRPRFAPRRMVSTDDGVCWTTADPTWAPTHPSRFRHTGRAWLPDAGRVGTRRHLAHLAKAGWHQFSRAL